ncbi:hypothetical protein CMI45_03295 [Candidatus Pacearchaeota archaeon]|nr:hypothetical protein [Candidatus Pacearchaeota archaeon]|tara:strand:+ start:1691 stop:2284 length:594 start_codon:yes stop_codon:yes gene_type:complete
MKIAIDLDDVISSTLARVIPFYNERTNSNTKREDYTDYDWTKIWGCSKEEMLKIWNEFAKSKNYEEILPIKDAIPSVLSLMEKNEITIMTARSRDIKNETLNWLKKYFQEKEIDLIFTGEFGKVDGIKKSKAEICNKLRIPLIIEDNGEYSLQCAEEGIKVILFDALHNRSASHENITRVSGWEEAMPLINKMQENQ